MNQTTIQGLLREAGLNIVDGKIEVPDGVTRLSIDVGLAFNAPQSATWLKDDPSLMVLGFEPLSDHILSIKKGLSNFSNAVNPELVGSRLFVVPCALGEKLGPVEVDMNITGNDSGCSSILQPTTFPVLSVERVNLARLDQFLSYVPWDIFRDIEVLKTDCQGYDSAVIRGTGEYISRCKVVICEVNTDGQYYGAHDNIQDFHAVFDSYGFRYIPRMLRKLFNVTRLANLKVQDPTWVRRDMKLLGKRSPRVRQGN